jgi:hypothetical protein
LIGVLLKWRLAEYAKLKENKGKNDDILFMDAVQPQHNPVLGYG